MSRRRALVACVALLAAFIWAAPALAHKPSDSYLTLEINGAKIDGRWDIALRDLDYTLGLDRDGNGVITWGELRARQPDIAALALAHLTLHADGGACTSAPGEQLVVDHSDGAYSVLHFTATCPAEVRVLDVDYELFFDDDPQHRGVARIDDGASTRTAIFAANERRQTFDRASPERLHQFGVAVKHGVGHIWSGIDHLLFLIALLLPSVLRRDATGWHGVTGFRPALVDVAKIVTAFTVAHSITLSLSALGLVSLPSRFVESAIAASVILAALNNIVPILRDDRWAAGFALGLLHGFAFSATLMDLGLPRQNLVLTLFGFNLGVEIGQFAVVLVFLPLAFLARGFPAYRRVALVGGSVAITALASVWFVERAFAIKILG